MRTTNVPTGYAPTVPNALALGKAALLLSTKLDTVAAWVIDGAEYISAECSVGEGTWPTNLIITLEVSNTGTDWFNVPTEGSAVTFAAAALTEPIDVRTYVYARLRISTVSSAAHRDVAVCIAGR